MKHDLEKARNLKLIFPSFKKLSDLKINFHKNEMFYFTRPPICGAFLM
jgi:hypothetical protein